MFQMQFGGRSTKKTSIYIRRAKASEAYDGQKCAVVCGKTRTHRACAPLRGVEGNGVLLLDHVK